MVNIFDNKCQLLEIFYTDYLNINGWFSDSERNIFCVKVRVHPLPLIGVG